MSINERFELIINEKYAGNQSFFARMIGVAPTVIANVVGSRKGKPSYDVLEKVCANANISPQWLLTGEGDMISQPTKKNDENFSGKGKKNVAHPAQNPQEGIPLIPFSAMAGALTGEQSVLEYECERYVVPAFDGADFLMPVKGNSMMPTYISGDIVACQRVPMSGLFFQWNKPYVLDTAQGAIIKRIKPGSDKQHVLIVSDNPDYDPYELTYSEIYAVALVIGIIRLE